jgi:hypothetical protein
MKLDMAKLKKMKMPESKKAAPEMAMDDGMAEEEGMDLELPELGSEEEEAPEHEAAESPEEEVSEHEAIDLSALSDEELMAELKKRGIMGKMGKA